MKRAEQKEKRQQEIMNAGLDLFIRKGYAATKISDIAKAVNMSTGLMFHYFESKEKLYFALLEFAKNGPREVFKMDTLSPIEFFESAAEMIISYAAQDSFGAKLFVLMSQAQDNESLTDEMRNSISRNGEMEKTVQLIQRGQKEGAIRDGNPIALSTAFWLSIRGVCENVARYPQMPVASPEWIVDIIRKK